MRKRLTFTLVLLFMVSLFVFQGCGKKEGEDVIKIGVIAPLTGEGATYGEAMKEGIDLAVEETNDKGGIDGKTLKTYYQDTKLIPKEGISGFNYLVQREKVSVVIGAAGSSVSLAVAPYANQNKVVLISPISTTDSLSDAGEYFFRNIPRNTYQAITAADFLMTDLGLNNFAIFYENVDYGKNMENVFRNRVEINGGKILISESYETGQKDFKASLHKIKQFNPEAVFIPGTYNENALILRQKTELAMECVFIGGDGAYSPDLLSIAGVNAEGFYLTMIGFNQNSELYKNYRDNFLNKYSKEPDIYSGFSYDIVKILDLVMREGNLTGEKIKDALHNVDYFGVSGRNKFDINGDVEKPYNIFKVINSQFEYYK